MAFENFIKYAPPQYAGHVERAKELTDSLKGGDKETGEMVWLWRKRGISNIIRDGTAPPPKVISPSQELAEIKRHIFERTNGDRKRHGLASVQWDELASRVGDAHCQEMLEHGYQSHWNLQGYKPYHRYSFAGGTDSVHENCSGQDANYDIYQSVDRVIASALECHERMMAERPPQDGHRCNILDPLHTHVGIGLAHNRQRLRMTQEFVHRYVTFSTSIPREVRLKQTLLLRGRLLHRKHQLSSMAIFYEPFPCPMSVPELNPTYSYGLPNEVDNEYPQCKPGWYYSNSSIGSILIYPNGTFECPIRFKHGHPGLYTICLWLKDSKGRDIPATYLTVRVRD